MNTVWIKAKGWIEIDNGLRIKTTDDFCKYYQWHINKAFWNTVKMQSPKQRAHVTIVNPKIHGNVDYSKVKHLRGKHVEFEYSVDMFISAVNFWLPVRWEGEKEIKRLLKVKDADSYYGLHLTVANNKFQFN